MHKNQQVSFEKILQKISSCMKNGPSRVRSDRKTGMSYDRLYETFQGDRNIHLFIGVIHRNGTKSSRGLGIWYSRKCKIRNNHRLLNISNKE
jgi:hypothetical protein